MSAEPQTYFVQAAAPQGFKPREGNNCNRWEAPEITCDVPLQAIAGHRTDAHYSISRVLDFRDSRMEPRVRAINFPERTAQENTDWPLKPKEACGPLGLIKPPTNGWRNQTALRDWYIKNVHCELCEGSCFVMVAIPPKIDMQNVYVYNECPVKDLEYTVNIRCPDDVVTPLVTVDASEAFCEKFAVPEALQFAGQNRIIEICIDKFPAAKDIDCERPSEFGVLSEACFAIAAAGVCPITGK